MKEEISFTHEESHPDGLASIISFTDKDGAVWTPASLSTAWKVVFIAVSL